MLKYAPEVSYKLVEEIAEDVTGSRQISDQGIQNIVIKKALKLSTEIKNEYLPHITENMLKINESVDIYDKESKEVILEMDGILTKEQKAKRDNIKKGKKSFVGTDIVILQNKKGFYDYIMSPIDKNGDDSLKLSDCIKSKIIDEYKSQSTGNPVSEYRNKDTKEALNIVVISRWSLGHKNNINQCFFIPDNNNIGLVSFNKKDKGIYEYDSYK